MNSAIALLNSCDDTYAMKQQRLAEMKFLRAYAHFLLKRLYKNIPFVVNENLTYDEYNNLSNRTYTNDEGWQLIIDDLMEAYNTLPVTQADKGRPTKAAAAAFLSKVYLYKAYRQDDANSNQVTGIDQTDLQKVIEFTDPSLYSNYGLEDDLTTTSAQRSNTRTAVRAFGPSSTHATTVPPTATSTGVTDSSRPTFLVLPTVVATSTSPLRTSSMPIAQVPTVCL